MKMKPIGDHVLIQEKERADKTESGIILVDGPDEEFIYADVISVGPGLFTQTGNRIPMTIKAGDTREQLVKMYPLVFEMVAETGYNMTGRDHIIAYNTERGV